jgi:glycosyltransferase involved in cell wall biosynthesis
MKKILHIYYGTRGTSGAYIQALQSACRQAKVNSWAVVSCNYQFKSWRVIKCFFPITDYTEQRNFLIKIIRGFELIVAYLTVGVAVLIFRPTINLHLIDDFFSTYLFYRACKLAGIKVYVTCHDVIAHDKQMNARRLKILKEADQLVVHSAHAKMALLEYTEEKAINRIIQYSYPYSSYEAILSRTKTKYAEELLFNQLSINGNYFLFIGYIRISKGIEILIDAWHHSVASNQSKLVIAGKWPNYLNPLKSQTDEMKNCKIINKYLTDEEFVLLIQKAKFVILPYLDYCHSALLMACSRHDGVVIISDIQLFKEIIPDYELSFSKGSSQDLARVIDKAITLNDVEREYYKKKIQKSVERSDEKLVETIKSAYKEYIYKAKGVLNED